MRKWFGLLLAVVLLVVPMVSYAAAPVPVTNFVWDPSTTYVGGASTTGDTITYKMYCGVATGVYTLVLTAAASPLPIANILTSAQASGKYFCAVTALSAIFGTESGFSNEVVRYKVGSTFLDGAATPAPGGNLRTN